MLNPQPHSKSIQTSDEARPCQLRELRELGDSGGSRPLH